MLITNLLEKLHISPFWLMLTTGIIGMLVCLLRRRRRFSLSIVQCICFTLLLTLVGCAGAKLLYILENIRALLNGGLSLDGVSFFGSVFLIPLLMPLVGRLFRLRGADTMDICGPCVAIMIGCMRFGCLISGCCGGWAVCIGDFCFHWPTQSIETIGDFMILFLLLQQEANGTRKGALYPMFMVLYSAMRFILEFLRATPKDWLLMSHGQWFSLAAVLVGLIWLREAKKHTH